MSGWLQEAARAAAGSLGHSLKQSLPLPIHIPLWAREKLERLSHEAGCAPIDLASQLLERAIEKELDPKIAE